MSFTLVAGKPGRTALGVYTPYFGDYLREVHVTNDAQKYTGCYSIDIGPRYNTADSADNTEYTSLNLTEYDIDNASVWLEFPDDDSFNVVSASLKSIISGDYMTTAEQLENFAPYFQMKHEPDNMPNLVSLDWCFVNPKTMEQITPDVSNVIINSSSVDGTSGTINSFSSWSVVFQYDYKGVTYIWNFDDMEHNDYTSSFYVLPLKAGRTQKAAILISYIN